MLTSNLIAVMIGGAIGAGLRFIIVSWVMTNYSLKALPVSTLLVNVLGSFAIGVVACLFMNKFTNESLRVFFIIGLLGSFTTVSSFSLETLDLFSQAQYLKGLLNIAATIILCISASWLGLVLTRQLLI